MLINRADQLAGIADAVVTGGVTDFVVDDFQIVHVGDHDCEFDCLPGLNLIIQRIFIAGIGKSVFYTGQRIGCGCIFGQFQLPLVFLFPLLHQLVICHHDRG